jgi:PAS domain S-box-containing protein
MGLEEFDNCDYQLLYDRIIELEHRVYEAELLSDASIDRIMSFNTELHITAWNKTCEVHSGKTKNEVLGKHFFSVFPSAQDNEAIAKAINMSLKGVKMFVPADKGSIDGGYHESHFIPLKDEFGTVTGVLYLVHDVAHRIKTENELKKLNKSLAKKNKDLKEKNRELASFFSIAGNDLKSPLWRIYSFSDIILADKNNVLSEESRTYFKRIQASIQRMNLLTDDIISYSHITEENADISSIDLNNVLRFVKHSLKTVINEKMVNIKADTLPVIAGNSQMLTQLFQNIISNALKFQEPTNLPHISITSDYIPCTDIKIKDAIDSTNYIRLSFSDNGIGFEKKYAERIFEMFQRLHGVNSYPGNGIGLAICRKIMTIHGGFITAESSPGSGSTFSCYFPIANT